MSSVKFLRKNKIVAITTISIIVMASIVALSTLKIQAANFTQGLKPIQTSTQNGITVSLDQVDFTSSNPVAVVCVDLPTNEDWLPHANLETSTSTADLQEIALLDSKNPATYSGTFRCYRLTFVLTPNLAGTQVRIVLDRFHTTIPELLSGDLCDSARAKVQVSNPGLDFSCVTASNGHTIVIKTKPEGLSEQQAMDLINNAMVKTVTGPWVFEVTP